MGVVSPAGRMLILDVPYQAGKRMTRPLVPVSML